jgi:arginyl-tRNA synthetase
MSSYPGLSQLIHNSLVALGVEGQSLDEVSSKLEAPKDAGHGDICFPCFTLSKALKKAPNQIAPMLGEKVSENLSEFNDVEKVEVVGPYLNFFLSSESLAKVVDEVLNGELLSPLSSKGEKVMIEYSQPNTHKAFHVGHMRNVALGDSLVRLYTHGGYEVTAANYIGDEGTHIAKCLWAYRKLQPLEAPTENRGEFLGGLYRKADEWLDFKLLTKYPFPGVQSAKVLTKAPHPDNPKWSVVELETSNGKESVVCGGTEYEPDDIVAHAPVGIRFGGRMLEEKDMKGVTSRGMVCGEKELGVSSEKSKILILDSEVEVGLQLTEIGRVDGALKDDVLVADEMERRLREVSDTLKELEDKDSPIQDLWKETREWSLKDFQDIYSWVDCRFDHVFYESEVGDEGKDLVVKALDEGKLVRSEGTVGADLSSDKLGYLMLLKSDGTGLYATKDLALADKKFREFGIDRSIYVVDYSQSLHFKQVFKTLDLLGYPQASKCFHLAYGLVTVPEGKMSSRKGTVIFFSALKEKLTSHILENQLSKHNGDWDESELKRAAQAIAVGTIKYGMLNQDNLRNIVFDIGEWTSLTGNTGPYLMYAYARTASIMKKLGDPDLDEFNGSRLIHSEERALMTELSQFSKVIERSIEQNKPQGLCIYLYNLARAFSRMFESCPVAKAEDEELKMSRLALVKATGKTLKKGLELIGITPLERM